MVCARTGLCLGVLVIGMTFFIAQPASADLVPLSDLNSTATCQTSAPGVGWSSWTIEGANQLTEQLYWVRWAGRSQSIRLGAAAGGDYSVTVTPPTPAPIDTNPLDDFHDDTLATTFTYEGTTGGTPYKFAITLTYRLRGGDLGSGTSEMDVDPRIENLGSTDLPIYLYQFTDFQAAATPAGDSLTFNVADSVIQQSDGSTVIKTSNNALPDPAITVHTHFGLASSLLAALDTTADLDFSDNRTDITGDVAYVVQWSGTVGVGNEVKLGEQSLAVVPEPVTLVLLAAGALPMLRMGRGPSRRRTAT